MRLAYVMAIQAVLASLAFGQGNPAIVEFDVASVKPTPPPTIPIVTRRMKNPGPGMLDYYNIPLKRLIANAYNVKEYQVFGPGWLEDDGFDIRAKYPATASQEEVRSMWQTLLAARFKLAFHREKRNLSVYALVADTDGPKLKETDPPVLKSQAAASSASPADPGLKLALAPDGGRAMRGRGATSRLVELLAQFIDKPVVDMTGLTGTYDVDVVWTPETPENALRPDTRFPAGALAPVVDNPTESMRPVMAAIRKSLGLRLEARQMELECLVVDGAQRTPTEN